MIVITGALGFIGSCLVSYFNQKSFQNIVVVDDFSKINKFKNLRKKDFLEKVERNNFDNWLEKKGKGIEIIIHIGARTDTAEFNKEALNKLNLEYTKMVWNKCIKFDIPLIYASSAATYGQGEHGFNDTNEVIKKLKPLNPYGESKNNFDKWALTQKNKPKFWVGLKFFNVYGPNEYHKGRMASVIYHLFNQINKNGKVNLFRSHNPNYLDGEQKRDFIFVKDLLKIIFFLFSNKSNIDNGFYNVGTGKARTFNDLANTLFSELKLPAIIDYIDTPNDIRDRYQYFTEANMSKLRKAGFNSEFIELEEGISDYVSNYLKNLKYF